MEIKRMINVKWSDGGLRGLYRVQERRKDRDKCEFKEDLPFV